MPREWKKMTLADISVDVAYGYTESASVEKVGPRFLRITDIQNGVVNWDNVPFCPISKTNHEKYRLQSGDIVVARTGNSTGENFLFRGNEDAVFASYLIRFRINQNQADPAFVWYNLRSSQWRDFINGSKTGSAQAGANAKVLGQFSLTVPPLAEQRAIADVLGALDDKIELNRRMNQTLEAQAQTIFKSWFIDAIATKLPKGWREMPFTNTVEILGGGTPKTTISEYWNGDIPWFSVVDAPQGSDVFVIDTEKKITQAGVDNSSTQVLPVGTTIISARGTVGKIALVGVPMAMNQSCYGLRGKAGAKGFHTYFATQALISTLLQHAHGSIFSTITQDTLAGVQVIAPPAAIVDDFEEKVAPMMERIRENLFESRTLAALRDALLPKLLSGELRVPVAAGKFAEAHA